MKEIKFLKIEPTIYKPKYLSKFINIYKPVKLNWWQKFLKIFKLYRGETGRRFPFVKYYNI